MIEKICEYCKNVFITKRHVQKCCSNQCATNLKKLTDNFGKHHIIYTKNCKYCFIEFKTRKQSQKYCCKQCSSNDRKGKITNNRLGKYIHCLYCGNEFYVSKNNINKIKFCSKKCYSNWQKGKEGNKKKTGFIKKCEHCGIDFYVQINQKKYNFCSAKCANTHKRGKPNLKKRNGKYVKCELCGNEFYLSKYRLRNKNFCNLSCWAAYRQINDLYIKISKPELIFKDILEKNNIDYIHQYYVKYGKKIKIFDFCIPHKKIFIEIDGIYWHGRNKTNENRNLIQQRSFVNDKLKNELAHNIGYDLIRIWEDEINTFDINILN